jgi:hypothetical protein
MWMRTTFRTLACALALMVPALATASPIYVGYYEVNDGPYWGTNPTVYSAREAAALVFGGFYTDYAISINSSSNDPTTITHTAWYDGWGEHQGMIFGEDYKLDTGAPGYADPGGLSSARSAYVSDGLSDTYRNYVWRNDVVASVPDTSSTLLLGSLAFLAVGALRRRWA